MIQIWWHFNCINTMLSKFFFWNYCFQFCTESLCMKVGQTPGDWEECSVSMPDQLTIKQKEQLCYLACSKWYIFFSLTFDKKKQCITVYNMLSIQFYYKAFFRASNQFHEYSLHCIDVNNSIINHYSQISIAR